MNGIDKIAGKIAADAKVEAEAILADARAQAGVIADEYARQAKEESGRILAAGQALSVEIGRRADSASDQEAKQQLLSTKQNMISRAFDEALAKLVALPEDEYVALLARLAADAAPSGGGEIVLSARDHQTRGTKVLESANRLLAQAGKQGNLTLSAQTGDFAGGLLLKSGDVEVNCTLETILRLSREELTLEVAAALFA